MLKFLHPAQFTCLEPFRILKRYGSIVKMAYTVFESPETNQELSPLIIMHRLLGSREAWRETASRVEEKLKRKVFSVDLRNHGESPHSNEHTYQHMAADLHQFMNDNKIATSILLGDGIGGCLAMYFALNNPRAVERGVVIDASPISAPRGLDHKMVILKAMKDAKILKDMASDETYNKVQRSIEKAASRPEIAKFVLNNLKKRQSGEYYWSCNTEVLMTNLTELSNFSIYIKPMQPFGGKMLMLCDNNAEYVTTDDWPMLQLVFPNSEIKWLNVGQLIHISQTEHFFDTLFEFLV